MSTRVTRRELAAALAVSAALRGQSVGGPSLPQKSDEDLKAARVQVRQNGEILAKFPIPMTAEPAIHFKA